MNNKTLKELRAEMRLSLGLDWREVRYEDKQVGWWYGTYDTRYPIICAGFLLGFLPQIKYGRKLDPRCGRSVYKIAKRLIKQGVTYPSV